MENPAAPPTPEQRLAAVEARLQPFIERERRIGRAEEACIERCRDIALLQTHGLVRDRSNPAAYEIPNAHDAKIYLEHLQAMLRADIVDLAREMGKP